MTNLNEIKNIVDQINHEWSIYKNQQSIENKPIDSREFIHKDQENQRYLQRPIVKDERHALLNDNYDQAFLQFLRKGTPISSTLLERKAIVSNAGELGYIATSGMMDRIYYDIKTHSKMRQIARNLRISTDTLDLVYEDEDELAGWHDKFDEIVNQNKKAMSVEKKSIVLHELFAQPKITQRLLDDPIVNIEQWLSEKIAYIFALKENDAFLNGDGKNKPQGLLSYDKAKTSEITTEKENTIVLDDLINLTSKLGDKYLSNAKIIVGREALHSLRKIKDSQNRYIWQSSVSEASSDKFIGFEVICMPNMPALASNNVVALFGDFNMAYTIIDRYNIRILRDPYTEKPYVKFYTSKQVGGGIANPQAFTVLKMQ